MNLRMFLLIAGLCSATDAFGSITVTPASPTSAQIITIRLETPFGALAHVTSASIVQVGNTFVIQQTAESICTLPQSSLLVSEFQVGPLASGTYSIMATTTITGVVSQPCIIDPKIQTAGFAVGSAVPALNQGVLLLLALALAGMSVWLLRN